MTDKPELTTEELGPLAPHKLGPLEIVDKETGEKKLFAKDEGLQALIDTAFTNKQRAYDEGYHTGRNVGIMHGLVIAMIIFTAAHFLLGF